MGEEKCYKGKKSNATATITSDNKYRIEHFIAGTKKGNDEGGSPKLRKWILNMCEDVSSGIACFKG